MSVSSKQSFSRLGRVQSLGDLHSPAGLSKKFEIFVAKRFLPRDRNGYSGSLVGIATFSIALGVMVMILSVSILRGFQGEIRKKVVGFGSHIVVTSYSMGNTYEETPILSDRPEVDRIKNTPGVRQVDFYAIKGGMIKTDDQIHGIIFKGVGGGFDSTFFHNALVEGRLFSLSDGTASNEVIVSKVMANRLHLEIGDKVRTYFWQGESYRARAFEVCGIYNTDLTDFDEHYMLGDLRVLQKINGWDSNQVGGYELWVDDFKRLQRVSSSVMAQLGYDLTLQTIVEQNPALFSWLELLDSNIVVIIVIMMMVCMVSIVSALLIMIFEKTSTIGLLKALGANNRSIRRIFLYKTTSIIAKGILLGNGLALLVGWMQQRWHIVRLDSASYMMENVPVDLNPWTFIAISAGSLAVCYLALLLPTAHISHIEPAKTIKVN